MARLRVISDISDNPDPQAAKAWASVAEVLGFGVMPEIGAA